MTIVESRKYELNRIRLEFIKPFAATNTTEFDFNLQGHQTIVTWTMSGENNFIAKAMHLFMNLDKMVGGQFENGLESMKTAVETRPEK